MAKDLNIQTEERKVKTQEVFDCDEAFFTGTAAEVTPIIQVNNHPISNGKPGFVTKKLQNSYFDLIHGKISKYNNWLSLV